MSIGLIGLLDDVAGIAKAAAAGWRGIDTSVP